MRECTCGHSPDDHIEDDDYSACVGALVDSTVLPTGYTTYEPCPCKQYKPVEVPQLVH